MNKEEEARFQAECDEADERYNRGETENYYSEEIPEDTPCLEIEGTVFDPSL